MTGTTSQRTLLRVQQVLLGVLAIGLKAKNDSPDWPTSRTVMIETFQGRPDLPIRFSQAPPLMRSM